MRQLLALTSILLLAACAGGTREAFDQRMSYMSGLTETQLVTAMGRIPDNSYQADAHTRILQWRSDSSYVDPGAPPYLASGVVMPGVSPWLVKRGCTVEWTVVDGVSRSHSARGATCVARL